MPRLDHDVPQGDDIENDQDKLRCTGKENGRKHDDIQCLVPSTIVSNEHEGTMKKLYGFLMFVPLNQPKRIRMTCFSREWINVDQRSSS